LDWSLSVTEAVNQAYKDLAFIWHPDRIPKDNLRLQQKAQEKLRLIRPVINCAQFYRVVRTKMLSLSHPQRLLAALSRKAIAIVPAILQSHQQARKHYSDLMELT